MGFPNAICSDLRVVELASVLAGPAVGMFFAELGATVVKVENKTTGGDVTRNWRMPSERPDIPLPAYYHSVNWGKESLLLDLTDPTDAIRVRELIAGADVLITNFTRKKAEKLGVDYTSIQALKPDIIHVNLTAYGENDERPGFDAALQAETGFLYLCGEPDRPPVKMPVALIDILAAHQMKEGVLLALLEKMRHGRGAYITVSLFDAAVAALANQASNWLNTHCIPQRMGNQHPNIAPYGDLYVCSDGHWLLLAVGTEKQFEQLCTVLGMPELPQDARFARNGMRVTHREALNSLLSGAIAQNSRDYWMSRLQEVGVPVALPRDMSEVFALPASERLVLRQTEADGSLSARVRTAIFEINPQL